MAQTQGWDVQITALNELTAKFGKPTSRKNTRMQNNFGVAFDVITAIWKKPTYTVTLRGVDAYDKDHGNIIIESKNYPRLAQAKKEWLNKNHPTSKM